MASNLTAQVRNIAEVATAIAGGDLSKKITVDVRGEILLLKDTLNTMVEQLRSFAAEVTASRVKSAPRVGWAVRPWCPGRRYLEGSNRQRQPARSQPDDASFATSPKLPPRWPAAICRARSRSM